MMINDGRKGTPFYDALTERISVLGGMHNAHLHIDRAGTLEDKFWNNSYINLDNVSSIALLEKHELVKTLHTGLAYTEGSLTDRVNQYLDVMVAVNTIRADSFVDVTLDNVELSALQTLQKIKKERANEITFNLAAYSPLGYRDDEPKRWDLLEKAVESADFIGSLPEADDREDYPEHIGFSEHCDRMLALAVKSQKEVHIHVDQRFEETENGTERLVKVMKKYGRLQKSNGEPLVWVVHVISPSVYDESRFQKLMTNLVDLDIGVICCPSAALGMRMLRPLVSPTYNCIARVLEMLAAGITVRIGSDNMADICSPTTTANLIDEVFMLSAALRFYHVNILARVAVGQKLTEDERLFVVEHLRKNNEEVNKVIVQAKKRNRHF